MLSALYKLGVSVTFGKKRPQSYDTRFHPDTPTAPDPSPPTMPWTVESKFSAVLLHWASEKASPYLCQTNRCHEKRDGRALRVGRVDLTGDHVDSEVN